MSYEIEERNRCWVVKTPTDPRDPCWFKTVVATCPTREAAEAARRLLSGECLRRYNEGKADAQIDRLVAAKTGEGKPMCRSCERGRPHYEDGLADGAAQERAKIVKWLRARHPWVTMANMAGRIERGEAGE